MSELTGPATAIPLDGFRIGSVGVSLPGVEVKLAEDGEILVRGGNVTPGYYRDPEFVGALIVLDQDVAPQWARSHGIPDTSTAELSLNPAVIAEIRGGLADANEHVSRSEAIKRFTILPAEWTAESEELTPTLKLRRRVIEHKYAVGIEAMYGTPAGGHTLGERAVAAGAG